MPTDLKTKTNELRREHILDAGLAVFAQHGFRGATIRDIATEAGVSDGTIYNVFENKEALLMGVLERLLLASRPAAMPTAGDSCEVLKRMIAGRWTRLTPETLAMMRVVWSEALINRDLAQRYLEQIVGTALDAPLPLLDELAKRGAIETVDLPMTMRLVVATFLGLTLLRILGDKVLNDRPGDVAQPLADLLLGGIFRHGGPDGSA